MRITSFFTYRGSPACENGVFCISSRRSYGDHRSSYLQGIIDGGLCNFILTQPVLCSCRLNLHIGVYSLAKCFFTDNTAGLVRSTAGCVCRGYLRDIEPMTARTSAVYGLRIIYPYLQVFDFKICSQ